MATQDGGVILCRYGELFLKSGNRRRFERVLCDNIYRMFARRLHNGYQTATPDTIFRHFIEGPGELQFTPDGINVALRARAHTPVLLDAGYHSAPPPSPGGTTANSATASRPPDPPDPTQTGSNERTGNPG